MLPSRTHPMLHFLLLEHHSF